MKPVNLLPARYRPRSGSEDSKRAYFALGGLAAVVLGLFMYLLTVSQIDSRNAEIEQTREQTVAAEARVADLQGFGEFAAIKQGRVAAVRTLATARVDWERLFRELAHVMPAGMWLTGFSGSAAGDAAATAGATGPSARLTGCAATHARVADAMVRLRELHAAEDVQLVSTTPPADEESTSSAGAAPADAASVPDGCGDHYTFELDVTLATPGTDPAEGAPGAVPARLGGGQ